MKEKCKYRIAMETEGSEWRKGMWLVHRETIGWFGQVVGSTVVAITPDKHTAKRWVESEERKKKVEGDMVYEDGRWYDA